METEALNGNVGMTAGATVRVVVQLTAVAGVNRGAATAEDVSLFTGDCAGSWLEIATSATVFSEDTTTALLVLVVPGEDVAVTIGAVITDSLTNGLAVPRTTSDNLFSNFSPDAALFW